MTKRSFKSLRFKLKHGLEAGMYRGSTSIYPAVTIEMYNQISLVGFGARVCFKKCILFFNSLSLSLLLSLSLSPVPSLHKHQ